MAIGHRWDAVVKDVCLSLLGSKGPILLGCCEGHSAEFPGHKRYAQGSHYYCNYYSKVLM